MLYNQTTRFTHQQTDEQTDKKTDRQTDKRAARQAEHCQGADSQVDKMVAACTIASMTAQIGTKVWFSPHISHASVLLLNHVAHWTDISHCLGMLCSHTSKHVAVTMVMMSDQAWSAYRPEW